MLSPKLSFVLCLAFARPICILAQGSSCEVPLVITRFAPKSGGTELVTDLAARDFSVKIGGSRAAVKSVSVDDGGKRIALILDASKKVTNEEWKLQTQMALSLLENARAVDKFSLSVVGARNTVRSFVAQQDMQTQLRDMASLRPEATDDNERIYDALIDAAKHFDPPAFGDTVFLFGHPDDSGSQAGLEQAEEMVLRNRLRFYALSLTDPPTGRLPKNFDLNRPLPKNAVPGGADDIAHATGYFFSYHQIEVLQRFPGQIRLLQEFLGDEYAGIAQPYKLEISPSPLSKATVEITILNAEARGIRESDAHFARTLFPCTSK